jgi:hypothetical protein
VQMKEVVNECGGVRRQLVACGRERAKQRRSRVSERLHQPGVTAQCQVGQARETILHVNQSKARTCLACQLSVFLCAATRVHLTCYHKYMLTIPTLSLIRAFV